TERVVPVAVLVTVRVNALLRVRNARSVIAGFGSTMSIEPLSVTVCASPLNVQPVISMRTESGTGSPSELVGGDGLRVGVQLAEHVAIAGAPSMGATANGIPGSAPGKVKTTKRGAWSRPFQVPLRQQQLRVEDRRAGGPTDRVVAERDEAVP